MTPVWIHYEAIQLASINDLLAILRSSSISLHTKVRCPGRFPFFASSTTTLSRGLGGGARSDGPPRVLRRSNARPVAVFVVVTVSIGDDDVPSLLGHETLPRKASLVTATAAAFAEDLACLLGYNIAVWVNVVDVVVASLL